MKKKGKKKKTRKSEIFQLIRIPHIFATKVLTSLCTICIKRVEVWREAGAESEMRERRNVASGVEWKYAGRIFHDVLGLYSLFPFPFYMYIHKFSFFLLLLFLFLTLYTLSCGGINVHNRER